MKKIKKVLFTSISSLFCMFCLNSSVFAGIEPFSKLTQNDEKKAKNITNSVRNALENAPVEPTEILDLKTATNFGFSLDIVGKKYVTFFIKNTNITIIRFMGCLKIYLAIGELQELPKDGKIEIYKFENSL